MFAYNAKALQYSFLFFFSFFLVFLGLFLNGLVKGFLRIFPYLLPRMRVTMIRFVSFGLLVNILFVICLLLLETLVTYDVSCALEKLGMAV